MESCERGYKSVSEGRGAPLMLSPVAFSLPRHSHGGTLKPTSPTPESVRPCVGYYDSLVLAGYGAGLPPPPACEPNQAGAEEEQRRRFRNRSQFSRPVGKMDIAAGEAGLVHRCGEITCSADGQRVKAPSVAAQAFSRPLPRGVTSPRPVTTTRCVARWFMLSSRALPTSFP